MPLIKHNYICETPWNLYVNVSITIILQMTKLITDYIGLQNAHQAAKLNRSFSSTNQISFMTWVAEGVINNDQPWQNWRPRFLALRGSSVYVFDSPPMSSEDWDSKLSSEEEDTATSVTKFKVRKINL